ncbi:MAG: lysostaphin resistance A-like protein [Chthoniobacterales bacterium]
MLEVVGVFVVATALARLASRGLGLGPANLRAIEPSATPDFVALSMSAAANLFLRYGFILALAFAVGWWHRRRRLADYGVATGYRSVAHLAGIGVLAFAAAGFLPVLLRLLADHLPLGRGPHHWALISSLDTPGIWLYLFVGSFGLVPIAEELFTRGYIQSRLTEDFGPAAAILITAIFFAFSHSQYFIASPIGAGMLVSLLISAIVTGYVRYRTGSLLPAIVAHVLGNLPFRGWGRPAVLVLMLVVVALWAQPIGRYAIQLWRDVITPRALSSAVVGWIVVAFLVAQAFIAPALLPVTGAIALVAALLLESAEKRARAGK